MTTPYHVYWVVGPLRVITLAYAANAFLFPDARSPRVLI
jgi:hypothetical protein